MEIFVRNIPYTTSLHTVTRDLADLFHSQDFISRFTSPLNFDLRPTTRRRPGQGRLHNGYALLTLPTVEIANFFLDQYSDRPSKVFRIGARAIHFSKSRQPEGRPDIIERILNTPYVDPAAAEERDRREEILNSNTITVQTIQFGWDGRNDFYSIEWEHSPRASRLSFDSDRREFQISMVDPTQSGCRLVISFPPSKIRELAVSDSPNEFVLYVSLWNAPVFFRKFEEGNSVMANIFGIELDLSIPGLEKPSQRLSCLPISDHGRVVSQLSICNLMLLTTIRCPILLERFVSYVTTWKSLGLSVMQHNSIQCKLGTIQLSAATRSLRPSRMTWKHL